VLSAHGIPISPSTHQLRVSRRPSRTVLRDQQVAELIGYGKTHRATIADASHRRFPDLVERNFDPPAPNRLWVADFTYVATWTGMVYVAFVID
jgi:transposase InsO family protein